MNQLTKDGLTGNSGFNVAGLGPAITHVSSNYAATKGKVFVSTRDMNWRRMTRALRAKENKVTTAQMKVRRMSPWSHP